MTHKPSANIHVEAPNTAKAAEAILAILKVQCADSSKCAAINALVSLSQPVPVTIQNCHFQTDIAQQGSK